MSVSNKILAILLVGFLAFAGGVILAQEALVRPGFESLERSEAAQHMARAVQTVEREIGFLDTFCGDWASWDDTWLFARGAMPQYVEANLGPATFLTSRINVIAIYGADGRTLWCRSWDLVRGKPRQDPDFPESGPATRPELLRRNGPSDPLSGVMLGPLGPRLVSARPILTSNGSGPVAGTLVMARDLDAERIQNIADQVRLTLAILPRDALDAAGLTLLRTAAGSGAPVLRPLDATTLMAHTFMKDISGQPGLLLSARLPRDITRRGDDVLAWARGSVLAGGLLVMLTVIVLLRLMVIRPLRQLTARAVAVGRDDAPDHPAPPVLLNRRDELGVLAREFEAMLQALEQSRKRRLTLSYQTGKAEMARGLLHTLRNALNPFVAELGQARETAGRAKAKEVAQAARELAAPDEHLKRTEKLLEFIQLAAEEGGEIQRTVLERIDALLRQASGMERILGDFERFARPDVGLEEVDLEELVRDAAALLPEPLARGLTLTLDVQLPGGRLKTNRSVLLQVLVNLLHNAADSLARAGTPDRPVIVAARMDGPSSAPVARIVVHDDGAGIAAEDLDNIFSREFSTKDPLSHGFGLHWCSGAVAMLGGVIRAESDGPGRGAALHLTLPQTPAPQE
ncbi:MAG: CHASE4 domain-containing protein [Desulfovibrionaceae bacterium]